MKGAIGMVTYSTCMLCFCFSMWKNQQLQYQKELQEKPMTREEMDAKIHEMIVERELLDEQARNEYLKSTGKTPLQHHKELPMTREEMDGKIQEMIAEQCQLLRQTRQVWGK